MDSTIQLFVIVAAVAIVIQMAILLGMFLAMRKTTARVDAIADLVEKRGVPVLESVSTLVTESAPKISIILDNAASASTTMKAQVERLDATVSDVVDRTRLQVIRVDDLVTRTVDRVEETSDLVHHTVISPVKALAGVISGVTATANMIFGTRRRSSARRARQSGNGGPDDEMFI